MLKKRIRVTYVIRYELLRWKSTPPGICHALAGSVARAALSSMFLFFCLLFVCFRHAMRVLLPVGIHGCCRESAGETAHRGGVNAIVTSQNEEHVFSAGRDSIVRLWRTDRTTKQVLRDFSSLLTFRLAFGSTLCKCWHLDRF